MANEQCSFTMKFSIILFSLLCTYFCQMGQVSLLNLNSTMETHMNDFHLFWNAISMHIDPKIHKKSHNPHRQLYRSYARNGRLPNGFARLPIRILPVNSKNKSHRPIDPKAIKASTAELKLNLKYLASLNRYDTYQKHKVRQYIFNTFQSFNLRTTKQTFKAPFLEDYGVNIIGVRPGRLRTSRSSNENVLVIGAHFDSVQNTTGLNDNGSGVSVMLELVRLMDFYQCDTKHTVIFVAFDLEESGAIGSKYFVHEYLIPNELGKDGQERSFKGAIILDTLLNHDSQPDSQDIPNDIHQNVPGFSELVKQNRYRGNFLAMFARTNTDRAISKIIERKWHDHKDNAPRNYAESYRLNPVHINTLSDSKEASYEILQRHVNMLRSDHLHFWYHNHTSYNNSLSAVLLTDTGPFRGYMRYCYHKMCDDTRFLNENNIEFVKKTSDVLLQVVLDSVDGRCYSGVTEIKRQCWSQQAKSAQWKNLNKSWLNTTETTEEQTPNGGDYSMNSNECPEDSNTQKVKGDEQEVINRKSKSTDDSRLKVIHRNKTAQSRARRSAKSMWPLVLSILSILNSFITHQPQKR